LNRTYAVGTLREPGDVRSAFLVRAYDVPTGSLLWENVWHASQGVDQDHPTGIFASPTQVIVVGYGENATRTGLAALVRVFDPLTGDVLWENRDSGAGREVLARTVVANQNRIFVAGTSAPLGQLTTGDLFVRAYDAISGDVEWETSRPMTSPTTLKLASGRLLVAGAASGRSYLAAYSAKSGALLWEDTAPVTPGLIVDLAVKDSRIAAAVSSFPTPVVRAYDLLTGYVQWEDRPTFPAGLHASLTAVGLNDGAVFTAGSVGEDFGPSEFMVRAYTASNGTLLWDDRSHLSFGTSVADLAVGKFRVFVVGSTSDGDTSGDFLIRAYDARVDTGIDP
jgi:glucose dehydrogenase